MNHTQGADGSKSIMLMQKGSPESDDSVHLTAWRAIGSD